jgi:tripartite-type tricarboxylate transporter receptor subunit TctC
MCFVFRRALAASLLALVGVASAQTYPTHVITLIVPYAPGGPTDVVTRHIAQKMTETLGQTVLVDNRPGGGGQIAGTAVKQAKPDGYTLFVGATEMFAINPTLFKKFAYDPLKDFTPVSALVEMPMILVVPKQSPANSVQDLIKMAKTKNEGLTYASQGLGSIGHMLGFSLGTKTGTTLVHVPYKGSAPALQDVAAGRVDMMFDVLLSSGPLIDGGQLKALAVASPSEFAAMPGLHTLTQDGVSGLDASVWFGMVAPVGTPEAVIATLNDAVTKAINSPDLVKLFTEQGMRPLPMTVPQFNAFMKSEINRWTAVVKASGARVD